MARPKQRGKRKQRSGRTRKRALPLSEAGLEKLATQINQMLASTHIPSMLADMDLANYVRLATVLVRLAEAGVKCEKHHAAAVLSKDGQGKPGLSGPTMEEIESQLHLL